MDLSNENVIHIKKEGIEYLQFRKLLEYENYVTHAFTIGIDNDFKLPIYGSKNTTLTKEQIEKNKISYKKICNTLGIEYNNIVKTNQVHKDVVEEVKEKVNKDEPDFFEEIYAETDGLLTNKKNIAICTTNADCIILMMYDNKKNVIANVHSGWKGTVQRIASKTIDKMQEIYNCNPKDIICCISPSIRKCHFEVDEDVKNIFKNTFNNIEKYIERNQEKWYIDTGLREENIIDSKICTVCNSKQIHSYRGSNHQNGLEMGIIELKK